VGRSSDDRSVSAEGADFTRGVNVQPVVRAGRFASGAGRFASLASGAGRFASFATSASSVPSGEARARVRTGTLRGWRAHVGSLHGFTG
jgi:hypothetical protein